MGRATNFLPDNHSVYRAELESTHKVTTGQIRHYKDGVVVSASTREWPIAKHLYRYIVLLTLICRSNLQSMIYFAVLVQLLYLSIRFFLSHHFKPIIALLCEQAFSNGKSSKFEIVSYSEYFK